MFPAILGISAAASALGSIFRPAPAPAPEAPSAMDSFKEQLELLKAKEAAANDPVAQARKIQTMLAAQHNQGLSADAQMELGKLLLNKTVQITDPSGANVIGKATQVSMMNSGLQITVNGRNYPITSVQAVIHGLN